jgi:Leucine-rich repeat (LRR) protein
MNEQFDIFSDLDVIKTILELNNNDVSDSRWSTNIVSEAIEILTENECVVSVDERVFVVSLVNRNISSLPPKIERLTELEILSLDDNNLSDFPPQISSLQKLESISVNRNNFSYIPEEIFQIESLEGLSFEQNSISTVSESIENLELLSLLLLRSNDLISVPSSIGNLSNLLFLDFRENENLNCLPQSIWILLSNGINVLFDDTGISSEGDTDCIN